MKQFPSDEIYLLIFIVFQLAEYLHIDALETNDAIYMQLYPNERVRTQLGNLCTWPHIGNTQIRVFPMGRCEGICIAVALGYMIPMHSEVQEIPYNQVKFNAFPHTI